MKFLFLTVLLFPPTLFADTNINICDRGIIGVRIARHIDSYGNCESVSKQKMASLKELNLSSSGGNIDSLPQKAFQGLTSLQYLNLNGNSFRVLPPNIFRGLAALETLYIEHTPLQVPPKNTFHGLRKLRALSINLDSNEDIPSDIFQGLSSLEQLTVFIQSAHTVSAGVFRGLSHLKHLSLFLSFNLKIPNDIFAPLRSLQSLGYSSHGQFNGCTIPTHAFKNLSKLEKLSISNGDWVISSNAFEGLFSLKTLFWRPSNLEKIEQNTFQGLSSLQELTIDKPTHYKQPISRSYVGISPDVTINGMDVIP